MKTETQIAKENVRIWKILESVENIANIDSHLATCRRWLEFLEDEKECETNECVICYKRLIDKIKDLQDAIKTYEDAGIK